MGRVRVPATALRRFWAMVAHYHGQIWNAAEPARALGVGESTTRRHLDLLTDAFMIRQLQSFLILSCVGRSRFLLPLPLLPNHPALDEQRNQRRHDRHEADGR